MKKVEAQAAIIEKLSVRLRKMKTEKLQTDFGIFNESQTEILPIERNSSVNESHRDMLEHLHNLLVRQGTNQSRSDSVALED